MFFNKPNFTTLAETPEVLIISKKGFPNDPFLSSDKSPESEFIKIIKEQIALNPKNPIPALRAAINLEYLEGSPNVCSGRVQGKHRVILIIRKIKEPLNKLVIVLIENDPNHKYRLSQVKKNCGSDQHWAEIVDSIISPPKPVRVHLPKQEPSTPKTSLLKDAPLMVAPPASPSSTSSDMPETQSEASDVSSHQETKENSPVHGELKEPIETPNHVMSQPTLSQIYGMIGTQASKMNFELLGKSIVQNRRELLIGLLNLGMDPNMQDANGMSLLHIAIWIRNYDMIQLLFSRGGELEQNANYSSLASTLVDQKMEARTLRLILEKAKQSGKINEPIVHKMWSRFNYSPLHLAIVSMNLTAVILLCKMGVDLTFKDADGMTPLQTAGLFWRQADEKDKKTCQIIFDCVMKAENVEKDAQLNQSSRKASP